MADGVSTRVILRVGEGHARRNRGAPTPRPVPRARIQEPTFPWRTVASRRLLALAPGPTADPPPQSTARAQAQRLACRARPAPRQAWGPPLDPGPAPPGQGQTRRPIQSP